MQVLPTITFKKLYLSAGIILLIVQMILADPCPIPQQSQNIISAITDLQTRKTSEDLYFAVKPFQSNSLTSIPFLIRTYWKFTSWSKIVFSFLAEDQTDMDAAYIQLDSSNLASCHSQKTITANLPYKNMKQNPKFSQNSIYIRHNVFLSGFQISTQQLYARDNTVRSSYQLIIKQSIATRNNGIDVTFYVNGGTQVLALHVSYVVWVTYSDNAYNGNIMGGSFTYQARNRSPNQLLHHSPSHNIGINYARVFGISGLNIDYRNQIFKFSTQWSGNKFIFDFGHAIQQSISYFNFQYVFFTGSECSGCRGYPYSYLGVCLVRCPAGFFPTAQKTCIACSYNQHWDGIQCIKSCPQGQFYNRTLSQCTCPDGLSWTGDRCIQCDKGRYYNKFTKLCQCPSYKKWNGYTCINFIGCPNGKQWNIFKFQCQCDDSTIWNGTYCQTRKKCVQGQYLNKNNQCTCPSGTYLKEGWCQATGCTGGQIWDIESNVCKCQVNLNWNGTVCLLCINGQVWNQETKQCLCGVNYRWNGNFCEKYNQCSGNRVYDQGLKQCVCPDSTFWNGIACINKPSCCCGKQWNQKTFQCQCLDGFYYDGNNCVLCQNGKQWNSINKTCECPNGSIWNGQFCVVVPPCKGGMIRNNNTWSCQCPSSSVWNGYYCISNPCQGGRVWDNSLLQCICPAGKTLINQFCIPTSQSCTPPKIWHQKTNTCECPQNTWDNGKFCQKIPKCRTNQIYNPQTNQCDCPSGLIWLQSKKQCGDPSCPIGMKWDGHGCLQISCPPNSYFKDGQCISNQNQHKNKCQTWQIFDGQKCIYYQNKCPINTSWNGKQCIPNNKCPLGFYGVDNVCKPLSQKCVPPSSWDGNKCVIIDNKCPYGMYLLEGECRPQASCSGGQIWNRNYMQCKCPEGTGWNGNQCIYCAQGQIWNSYQGCICPQGFFFKNQSCLKLTPEQCPHIPNTYWHKNTCTCLPGYTKSQSQCICKGIAFPTHCNNCIHKPNTIWNNSQCQCKPGYTNNPNNQCILQQQHNNNNTSTAIDCQAGSFFDNQQQRCIPCSVGCLSCQNMYECKQCNIDFIYDIRVGQCLENCGDGRKYVLECDDGNNRDGDGCSRDCKIEQNYVCRGGSPASLDNCTNTKPQYITIIQTGQIRYSTKISITIKLDYLPTSLLNSQQCNNLCSSILTVNILSQNTSYTSLHSYYITGTTYSFTLDIQFGQSMIRAFKLEVGLNQKLGYRYFLGIDISRKLVIDVNPAFLTVMQSQGGLLT